MKTFLFAVIVAFSSAACLNGFAQETPAAGVHPPTPLEESLIAQSRAVPQAEQAKDLATLQHLLTDDFQQVGSEGALHDKKELLDDAKEGRLTSFTLYNFRVLPVDENTAIVSFDAVIQQPEGDNDFAPRYQRISNIWVKQAGQWRLRFQQSTPRRPVD